MQTLARHLTANKGLSDFYVLLPLDFLRVAGIIKAILQKYL